MLYLFLSFTYIKICIVGIKLSNRKNYFRCGHFHWVVTKLITANISLKLKLIDFIFYIISNIKKKGKISIYKEQVIILKKIKNYVNLNNLPKQ